MIARASVRRVAYDSFGNLTASTGSLTNPFRYTARESDTETGLYYYRARYYDSQAGRFLAEDPLGPKEEGPNLYEYVSNNPIMSIDPLGRYKIDKSCTNHPCIPIGGGGPNYPNQPPHLANVQQLIQQEADEACSNLNGITDPKTRSCIQKRCKSGTSSAATTASLAEVARQGLMARPLPCALMAGLIGRRLRMSGRLLFMSGPIPVAGITAKEEGYR